MPKKSSSKRNPIRFACATVVGMFAMILIAAVAWFVIDGFRGGGADAPASPGPVTPVTANIILPKDGGGFRYVTVLLDAQGRTVETEVSQQEGEPVYELMQRIKANPLLEQVYRQIVMPLLDQLVAAAKQAKTAPAAPKPPSTGEPEPG